MNGLKSPNFPLLCTMTCQLIVCKTSLQRTVQTLAKPVSISQGCMDALPHHILHRLLAQQADHIAACDTILNHRQPQRYVGGNLAMPEAVRFEGVRLDAPARDPAPPCTSAQNFDNPPDELVGIPQVYEGDDATSAVEAPHVALRVCSHRSVRACLFWEVAKGTGQISIVYMMNRRACTSPPPFLGRGKNMSTMPVEPLPCWVLLFTCSLGSLVSIV